MNSPVRPKQRFITRLDIVFLLSIIMLVAGLGVVVKLVLQRDTYITVEMLASGGEWWWGVPPPFYWNTRDLTVGAKQYDSFDKPLVEVLDVIKYGEDDRSFVWMKTRLRVKRNYLTREYVFQQEPMQIGKTIHIAPNNVALIGQVVGIEGVGRLWNTEYITLTGKVFRIRPWEAASITVGDKVMDNHGELVAEVLEKSVEQSDTTTTTWQGELLARKDPLWQDVTVKLKLRIMKDGDRKFFNYNQPLVIGNKMRVQFKKNAFEIHIMDL